MICNSSSGLIRHAQARFGVAALLGCWCALLSWVSSAETLVPPVSLTAEEDHRRMMKLLGIESLRPGANGMDASAPNAANYDEAKANPYPALPDPLRLKSGEQVLQEILLRRCLLEVRFELDKRTALFFSTSC